MSYSDVALALGPAAYYKMDESSGVPQDSSPNRLHATSASGLTYRQASVLPGAGPADASSAFSMTASGNIVVPKTAVSSFTGPWTAALWVAFGAATSAGTGQMILTCGDTTSTFNGFTFTMEGTNTIFSYNYKPGSNSSAGSVGITVSGGVPTDGTSKIFCAIWGAGTSNGSAIGIRVGTQTSTSTLNQSVTMSSNPFHIGYAEDTFWQRLTGRVSNAGFWTRVLSADELTRLYVEGYRGGVSY